MKKNSFWETYSNYTKFQIIAAIIMLFVILVIVVFKALFF